LAIYILLGAARALKIGGQAGPAGFAARKIIAASIAALWLMF
jgi:hypothetical protein